MELLINYVCIHLLATGWLFTTGECSGNINDRVTHQDPGIDITWNTDSCELILQSSSGKQVVASLYALKADCIEKPPKGHIQVYDGRGKDRNLLISSCQTFGNNVSYASQRNALTIKLLPEYKPFRLNVYSIDTHRTYTKPNGTITSVRYPGFYANINALTSPNNLEAFYNIIAEENVTIHIHFKEFNVAATTGGHCTDFVKILGITPSIRHCGENTVPDITTFARGLSIEFQTDAVNSYTGFEIGYIACFDKRRDPNKTDDFQFPMYHLHEEMRCFLDIQLWGKCSVTINMTITSELTGRKCKDIIMIKTDYGEANLTDCKLRREISLYLISDTHIRLIFTSKSNTEFAKGTYTTRKIHEKTTTPNLSGSFLSHTVTTSTPGTGISTSSDENGSLIRNTENAQKGPNETPSNYATIIIIAAVVTSVSVVAIITIAILITRRRRNKNAHTKNGREQEEKGTGMVDSSAEKDEVEIYVGNEDYDVMRIQRKHKATPKEGSNNAYEETYGQQTVYAVVNRMKSPQKSEGSDEYNDHRFEIVYDHTERHPNNARNENFYE